MDKRIVKYEVRVSLEGDGSVLGLPDAVGQEIEKAIKRSESEGVLSAGAESASATLQAVTLLKDDRVAHPTSVRGRQFRSLPPK
jgi:hypothetical protein